MTQPKVRKHRTWLWVVELVLVMLLATAILYVSDYSHATPEATAVAATATTLDNGTLAFGNPDAANGIIFYPGGKVEYTAYAPLMQALSQKGFLCLLVKMPFNLAVLDTGAANGLPALYPNISHWYMAGHSLGGSMAALYISDHHDLFDGLILLAAYSTADLRQKNLKVLTMYGSQDTVLSADRLTQYRDNLPTDAQTVVIEGGCHAYFGDYGVQKGDGVPTITREQQVEKTVEAIVAFAGV